MTDLRMTPLRPASELTIAPSLEEVRELSSHGGQVALAHSWIADCETPVAAFLKLRDGGPAFLLESAEHGRLGRYSMIGVRPQAIVRGRDGELVHTAADGAVTILNAEDPFAAVQDVVEAVGMLPATGPPLPFAGGAVGYFAYDLVRRVEPIGPGPDDDLGLPELMVMITGPVVVFDHLQHTLTVSVPCVLSHSEDPEAAYRAAVATIAEAQGGPDRAPDRRARARAGGAAAPGRGHQQHDAGGLPCRGGALPRVHLRRRRVPDRPLAAVLGRG